MTALFALDLAPSFMESNGSVLAIVAVVAGVAALVVLVARRRR